MDISLVIKNLMKGKYPFKDGGIDYELFSGWDNKLDEPITYLNIMAGSNDYIVLHLLSYTIENMCLVFIENNKVALFTIVKKAMLHNCSRANFYLFKEAASLISNKDDMKFYLYMLNHSNEICQNEGVSLLRNLEQDILKIFQAGSNDFSFVSFLEDMQDLNPNIFIDKSDLFKKIYITGLNTKGIDKFRLIELVNEKNNYNLMDYMYIYLN